MKKLAFLFPGQGSQTVGMGHDLYTQSEAVKALFDIAGEITGLDLVRLCFEGPMSELTQTVNLQPAVTVINLACFTLLTERGIKPDFAAGHSLGEYSALAAACVISYNDTIRLVYERGRLMHREAEKNKGAMSAVIGLTIDKVSELVDAARSAGIVSVANHNTEKQIVITGSPEAVQKAASLAKDAGAKTVPLRVSGAWHSDLILGARDDFDRFISGIDLHPPRIPLVFNTIADYLDTPDEIKENMVRQLHSPVRWYDSLQQLFHEGVNIFLEVGPGNVLAGLLKKSAPKEYPYTVHNVYDMETLENFIKTAR